MIEMSGKSVRAFDASDGTVGDVCGADGHQWLQWPQRTLQFATHC